MNEWDAMDPGDGGAPGAEARTAKPPYLPDFMEAITR